MTFATAPRATISSREALSIQREPVLVALKPYDGSDAALDVAQWLAAEQERPLHAITVLEPNEMLAVAASVPITRLADRPVVVVPANAKHRSVTGAVVAMDFSPGSLRAARFALEMLSDDGQLTLVHVKSAVNLSEEGAGWWEEAYGQRTAELFRRFAAQLLPERGITLGIQMLQGDVASSILAYARKAGAELIACGGRQHSFIERVLLGSVSTELIRRADCTVVVVPDRALERSDDVSLAVGGGVESWDAKAWPGLIERFGQRNGGRATQLRFTTAGPQGAGSVEHGYHLVDATFDRAASRAEIVLGDPDTPSSQLSHRISNVRAVMVSTDATGRDTSLRLDTVSGRCTLVLTVDS